MLSENWQKWSAEDISRWLNPHQNDPETPKQPELERQKCAESVPEMAHEDAPQTQPKEVEVRQNYEQTPIPQIVELTAGDLLKHCPTPNHDPLELWTMSHDALLSLLGQCPVQCVGSASDEIRIIGDTNLASAILQRLPPDFLVKATLHTHDIDLHERLDIILRAPVSHSVLEEELNRHKHLLGRGTTSPSTKVLAAFLGVTEAAIRKARSRAKVD